MSWRNCGKHVSDSLPLLWVGLQWLLDLDDVFCGDSRLPMMADQNAWRNGPRHTVWALDRLWFPVGLFYVVYGLHEDRSHLINRVLRHHQHGRSGNGFSCPSVSWDGRDGGDNTIHEHLIHSENCVRRHQENGHYFGRGGYICTALL